MNLKTLSSGALDSIAPVRTRKVKQWPEPWFTGSIEKREKKSIFSEYRKLLNEIRGMKDRSKVNYYRDNLAQKQPPPKKKNLITSLLTLMGLFSLINL